MELIDALNQKGQPYEIPDSSRENLPELFIQMNFKVGAEIGTYKGEFTEKFCKAGMQMFAIDQWLTCPGTTQIRQDQIHEHAIKRLSAYPKCKIIHKTSMDALSDFEDNSLDFVYIDATHNFKDIAADIQEWTKKVKPGGIISGHDYFFEERKTGKTIWDVSIVLKAYIECFKIPNWYLIGSQNPVPGEIRDKWLSWMFVKP